MEKSEEQKKGKHPPKGGLLPATRTSCRFDAKHREFAP
jgi:hypothetical protein